MLYILAYQKQPLQNHKPFRMLRLLFYSTYTGSLYLIVYEGQNGPLLYHRLPIVLWSSTNPKILHSCSFNYPKGRHKFHCDCVSVFQLLFQYKHTFWNINTDTSMNKKWGRVFVFVFQIISQLMVFMISIISMVFCGHTELALVSLATAVRRLVSEPYLCTDIQYKLAFEFLFFDHVFVSCRLKSLIFPLALVCQQLVIPSCLWCVLTRGFSFPLKQLNNELLYQVCFLGLFTPLLSSVIGVV